jgi:O-antigen/teichoic acid export membrane protein
MGIFNAANQFFLVLGFLPRVIWQVSLPMLSGVAGRNDFVKLRKSYHKLLVINIVSIVVCIAMLAPVSGIIMNKLGKDFTGQTLTLAATLATALFYVSADVAWQIMIILGRMWASLIFVGLHIVVYIGTFMLLKDKGAYGLTVARLMAYAAYAAITMFYVETELAKK